MAQSKKPKNADRELLPLMFEMGRLLKAGIHEAGVPVPSFLHVETLRFIEEQGNPSMREVAVYLKIAPPSATALVNTFVREGVLARTVDPEDRRIVRLKLSKKGERLLGEIRKRREEAFARFFAPLSAADKKELCRILTIITRPQKPFKKSK